MNSRKDEFLEKEDNSAKRPMEMPKRELMTIVVKTTLKGISDRELLNLIDALNPFNPFRSW